MNQHITKGYSNVIEIRKRQTVQDNFPRYTITLYYNSNPNSPPSHDLQLRTFKLFAALSESGIRTERTREHDDAYACGTD